VREERGGEEREREREREEGFFSFSLTLKDLVKHEKQNK
jgi:hypothetical protein